MGYSAVFRFIACQQGCSFTLDIWSLMRHCGCCRTVIDATSGRVVRGHWNLCSLVVSMVCWSARLQLSVFRRMAGGVR